MIGRNENNTCTLECILNSRQRFDHRSEIILKPADSVWCDAGLLSQFAHPPAQCGPRHSNLRRRDHRCRVCASEVDKHTPTRYDVPQCCDCVNRLAMNVPALNSEVQVYNLLRQRCSISTPVWMMKRFEILLKASLPCMSSSLS